MDTLVSLFTTAGSILGDSLTELLIAVFTAVFGWAARYAIKNWSWAQMITGEQELKTWARVVASDLVEDKTKIEDFDKALESGKERLRKLAPKLIEGSESDDEHLRELIRQALRELDVTESDSKEDS